MKFIWKELGTIGVIFTVVFAWSIGGLVGKSASERFFEGKREAEMNSVLVNMTSELNKNLPMMIDAETRIDSIIGIDHQVYYKYTMINYSAEEVDAVAFNKTMQPILINSVCTAKEMEVFVKNGVSVTYDYYGKNGKQFSVITIKPERCQNG